MNPLLQQSLIVGSVALLSSIIGGIIPGFIQRKSNHISIKRQKLEELYWNIEKWYNSAYGLYCHTFGLVMNGHIDWNDYLDSIIESKSEGDHIKSEIIMFLYFKSLENDFLKLRDSVHKLSRYIEEEIKTTYIEGLNIKCHRNEWEDKICTANISLDELKESMSQIAKEL